MPLILASGSQIRHAMLDSAGVAHIVEKPGVDEGPFKQRLGDPVEIARRLAEAKALAVSTRHSDALVIGSDSVVCVDGRLFDKPTDRAQAAEHLHFFSGKSMRLTGGVALARGGLIEWRHVESAELTIRPLSDSFIAGYLDAEWPEVGDCVGVFRMEGRGVQLFSRVEGSHFTILGMPLLPLLEALRDRGVLPS